MAFVTIYGGGTIRDILIGVGPLTWMNDYRALLLVAFAVAIVFMLNKDGI